MSNITNTSPIVTEDKLKDFYEDIKPYLGCPAYVTQEGDSEYYSTDEKVVGRWVDGKPLYQKVITGTTPSTTTNTIVYTFDTNVVCHSIDGLISNSVPINYYGSTSYSSATYIEEGYKIRMIVKGYVSSPFIIVAQYTKTTDSASTTIEQKPTHYSTDEQVVGTWIDGKPLYQKTVSFGALPNNSSKSVAHNINNIKDILDIQGIVIANDGGEYKPINYARSDIYGISAYANKSNVIVKTGTTMTHTAYFTLQYTKTTD